MKYELDEKSWILQGVIPADIEYDFDALWSLHPENYGQIKIYGKLINTPRWTQSYCQSYWYSGMMHPVVDLPVQFEPFLAWARSQDERFNQVLVNWYAHGDHYIGAHTDNESQIKKKSPILSISLGDERIFRIRSKDTKQIIHNIPMQDKSYLIMCGETQQHFTHEMPKSKSLNKRISLTFRIFN